MTLTIREARPSDAAPLIAYMQEVTSEPNNNLLHEPGEFKWTVEEEEKFLQSHLDSDNSIFLLALDEGQIVGLLGCTGGNRSANRHATYLGMSVHRDRRGQGVGTALMAHVVEWARGTGVVRRIELHVFVRNERAIHLYEKFGFKTEGRQVKAYFKGGEYIDGFVMALLI